MELTNAMTCSPWLRPRSSITGPASRSVSWSAASVLMRSRPGSPWMPMPISTSSSPRSKVGVPAAGTVQEVSASPIERTPAITLRARSVTLARSAPPLGVGGVLDRHVVVDDHALDLAARLARQVGGHLEVHHVAGVVLDDVQHPGAGVDLAGGPLHLVGRWRGEHRSGTGGVEHAAAHEPAVHRLVAGAAAA